MTFESSGHVFHLFHVLHVLNVAHVLQIYSMFSHPGWQDSTISAALTTMMTFMKYRNAYDANADGVDNCDAVDF